VNELEKLEFEATAERTTKNTIRFAEDTGSHLPYVNTVYVQKWALSQIGNPQKIRVTIEKID